MRWARDSGIGFLFYIKSDGFGGFVGIIVLTGEGEFDGDLINFGVWLEKMDVGVPPFTRFDNPGFGRKGHNLGGFGVDDFGGKVKFALIAIFDADRIGSQGAVSDVISLVARLTGGSVGINSESVAHGGVGSDSDGLGGQNLVLFTDEVDSDGGGKTGGFVAADGLKLDDLLGER